MKTAWWRELALCAGGCALEAAAVAAALGGEEGMALAAHAGGCGALGSGLGPRLAGGRWGWSLIFLLAAFLPAFGALGLLITAALGTSSPSAPAPEWVRAPLPGAGAPPAPGGAEAWAGPPSRGEQVAAARRRSDPQAIAALRRAIEDPDEDVRLVAHAVLEGKGRAAERRLHQAARALESAPADRRGPLRRRLAAEQWELAWLGLAQGEYLDQVLADARRHCLAALADDPGRATLHLLLGRVELRLGEPGRAEAALERAVRLGLPEAIAAPYRAEAAFLRRRFDEVRAHLRAAPAGASPAVDRLRRYWA